MRRCRSRPSRSERPGRGHWPRVARLAAGLVLLAITGLSQPAVSDEDAGGEAVLVRAATHPTFGRLVVEWPAPIEAVARVDGDRFRVRFARPLELDADALRSARQRLTGYVTGIERGRDARELAVRLVPDVTATLEIFDRRIVALDLTQAPAGTMPAGTGVELRTGIHDGFSRIVFDWGRPVAFRSTATGDRLVVEFEANAKVDTGAIGTRLGRWLARVDVDHDDDRTRVTFELRPGVGARVFPVEDRSVVVDLDDPEAPAAMQTVGAPPAAADPTPTTTAGRRPQPPDLTAATSSTTPPQSAALVAPDDPPQDAMGMTPPQPPVARAAALPSSSTPLPDRGRTPIRVPFLGLEIGSGADADGVYLDFAWSRPVGAAMWVRAGYVWAAFAARSTSAAGPTIPKLAPAVQGYLGPGEVVAADGGTALRFPLRRPLALKVERRDLEWRLHLHPGVDTAVATPDLVLTPRRLSDPARVRLEPNHPVRIVAFTDPEVHDRLAVWPLASVLAQQRQQLIDVDLLATAQGLAWRPRSDRLETRFGDDSVELVAPDGLWLTTDVGRDGGIAPATRDHAAGSAPPTGPTGGSATDTAAGTTSQAGAAAAQLPADGAIFGLPAFELRHGETLAGRRIASLYDVVEQPEGERNAARLNLARFFLGQALAAETLAVLGVMDETTDPAMRLARQGLAGAADFLMGRIADAEAGLGAPELDADPEVALWRAALAAAQQDWPAAARELAQSESTLFDYPQPLQLRLGLAAALIAIETDDPERADQILDRLERRAWPTVENAEIMFVRGLAQARNGEVEAADRSWRPVEHEGEPVTQIKAAYARMNLMLEAELIGPHEALAKLAPLRRLWRGHPWEFEMLAGLARLQARAEDYASAIRTWREALIRFADAPEAPAIALTMRDTLVDALLGTSGRRLDPVRAYALYQDFGELVPDDRRGDRVRRRLVDQLAGLDLIQPAAELLGQLIDERLTGVARAAAGADLAELWLRAPAPAAALTALDRSDIKDELGPDLSDRRLGLRARSLAQLGETETALALLADRTSPAINEIRADLLWQTRDWPGLITALGPVLARPDVPDALDQTEQMQVIRLVVAHAQTGRLEELQRLRARFGPAMRGLPAEPAFLMATLTPGTPVDPEAVLAVADDHLQRVNAFRAATPATQPLAPVAGG